MTDGRHDQNSLIDAAALHRSVLRLSLVVGGWPRILRDGVDVAVDAADGRGDDLAQRGGAPSPDRDRVLARQRDPVSVGGGRPIADAASATTLVELAAIMRQLGAWQAMNFDGGGSTTMVVDGTVVNVPSDPTGEREVGSALAVVRKR